MTASCVVSRVSGIPVTDPATGADTFPSTTIYTGKCRLRMPFNRTTGVAAAGQSIEKQQPELWLPISDATSANVRPDDVAVVTSPLDPEVVTVRIAGLHAQTHSTSRRLHVEIQT